MAKHNVLILGAGKIGSLIACLFAGAEDYSVHIGDLEGDVAGSHTQGEFSDRIHSVQLDAQDKKAIVDFVTQHKITALVSGLPYYCNKLVAQVAADHNLHYFDLTEDVEITRFVQTVSEGRDTAFVPQCGLAPGFISIVTNALMQNFETVDTVKMRVGALPVNPNNALKYSLTWSTDGLINEYGNLCYGIENGTMTTLLPLEGYETITIDGLLYEAFNTSGGLGSLAETYSGKVSTMNYKTLRYPGHCKKVKLLMNDLKMNNDRENLKTILERSIPKTKQDVVVIYVAVSGMRDDDLFEENYVKKIYPHHIAGQHWSAIQVTTAAGICAVVDIVLQNIQNFKGMVRQEDIQLDDVLANRFGHYYAV